MDPRATAYAAGELHGREREKFEAEMATSAVLRKEADEMTRLAAQLVSLPKPTERFSSEEKTTLLAQCVAKQRTRKLVMLPVKIVTFSALGVAASLVGFVGLALGLLLLGFPLGGSGPWASGAYYPGHLNGKYLAVISGANTTGIAKFELRDGAPPFANLKEGVPPVSQQQSGSFAIFSSGKQLRGTVVADVDHDSMHLAVSLAGESKARGGNGTSRFGEKNPLAEQAGSKGSFIAGLSNRREVFHFSGVGEIAVDQMNDPKSLGMQPSSAAVPLADRVASVTNLEIQAAHPAGESLNVPIRITGWKINNNR